MFAAPSERVLPEASLFGRTSRGNSWKRMRVGSATPGPKVNTSRVPSEGMNDNRLTAASETAERISDYIDHKLTIDTSGTARNRRINGTRMPL